MNEQTRTIYCQKLKTEAEGLAMPPFPDDLGQKIFDHISKQAWQMWLNQQTILINEYRLNLSDEQAQHFLREQLQAFLFES